MTLLNLKIAKKYCSELLSEIDNRIYVDDCRWKIKATSRPIALVNSLLERLNYFNKKKAKHYAVKHFP